MAATRATFVTGAHGADAVRQASTLAAKFDADGYAIVRGALSPDEITELRNHIEHLIVRYPEVPLEHLHHPIQARDAFWTSTATHPAILDAVQAIAPRMFKDGIALFASHYFCKEPRPDAPKVLLHQDAAYWPLEPMEVLTVWLAVDRSTRENGCLKVVPGTHKGELRELRKDTEGEGGVLGSHTHAEDEFDAVEYLELEPGDFSVHHPMLVHGSDGNTGRERRCGLTIRLMKPSTVCTDPTHPVFMLRGEDSPKNAWRAWPELVRGVDFDAWAGAADWNRQLRGGKRVRSAYAKTAALEAAREGEAGCLPEWAEAERAEVVSEVRAIVHSLGGRMLDE